MQVLLLISVLAAIATAKLSCEECVTVMDAWKVGATDPEDIRQQVELLVAEVCPQAENPDICMEQLPAFWSALAPIMWSAALDSSVWCTSCFKSGATCENCTGFIAAVLETLNTSEAEARVADFLAGEAFCDSDLFEGPVEQCANAVVQLIPLAFQILTNHNNNPENINAFCQATLGVC